MNKITQSSTKQNFFWQPTFTGDVLNAMTFWWRGQEISIPQTDLSVMVDGDKIYVENDPDPLHLLAAGETNYTPLSGDKQSSPGPMVWKEAGVINYIYHEDE